MAEAVKIQSNAASLDYVVDIVALNKSFTRQTKGKSGYTTIKSLLLNLFKSKSAPQAGKHNVTHAIKDLTLRIPRGTSVGIIGRNGSGKSTFLKLITGIYKPDNGNINVLGKVAALIELGAGFHPDFTGRENLYLASVMHGLTKKQVDERFDEIVDFADLREVIDDPVRTYSSGMFMRLGFSVAVHTDPDILLVDEVLAVGDAAFVAKCKEKIAALHRAGKTLLLVTHDLDAVERWCDEAIWLNKGEVKDRGYPRRVIDNYRQHIERGEEQELLAADKVDQVPETAPTKDNETQEEPKKARWGSREIEIVSVNLLGSDGQERRVLHPEDSLSIVVNYKKNTVADDVVFGVGINRADGLVVFGSNTDIERIDLGTLGDSGQLTFSIDRLGLLDGTYELDLALHRKDGYPFDYHKAAISFSVRSELQQIGVAAPKHHWSLNSRRLEPK